MYQLQTKLENFGKTLKVYQQINRDADNDNLDIKKLSFKCNLVDIFTKIFHQMTFSDRSIESLDAQLVKFNDKNNGIELSKEDLLNLGWLRIIFNQVFIPTQITYSISSYRQDVISDSLSDEQKTAINFLLEYQSSISNHGTISTEDVESLISNTECSIEDIKALNIFETEGDKFIFHTDDYGNNIKHFAKDILLNFYHQICDEENPTIEQVRVFIQLVNKLKFYFELPSLTSLISDKFFFEKLKELINSETDLDESNIEWLKYVLDNPRPNYDSSFDTKNYQNPAINSSNAVNIIRDIHYFNQSFHASFSFMQNNRRIYDYLIQSFLEISYSLEGYMLKECLTNPDKPYLTYKSYHSLKEHHIEKFPQIILEDYNFITLVFSELNNLKIPDSVLHTYEAMGSFSKHEKDSELEELRTEFCVTFFKICFNKKVFQITCGDISPLSETLIYFAKEAFNDSTLYTKAHNKLRFKRIFAEFKSFFQSIHEKQANTIIHEIIQNISENFKHHDKSHYLISIDYSTILLLSKLIEESSQLNTDNDSNEEIFSMLVSEHISWLFSCTKVNVLDYQKGSEIELDADIFSTATGLEEVDWNTTFATIYKSNKLDEIYSTLIEHLKFDQPKARKKLPDEFLEIENSRETTVNTRNPDELHKIELLFKMCCLAYSRKNSESVLISNLNYKDFYFKLEQLIYEMAHNYKNEDRASFKNLFAFPYKFHRNRYYKTTRECLFDFINHLNVDKSRDFLNNFFHNSNNLGLMLEAINTIENNELQESLSEKINTIDPTEYITNHVFLIDELEQSMIYAVNSSSNFLIAKQFLDGFLAHHKKRKHVNQKVETLAKQIELLIALKSKDIVGIKKFRNDSHTGISSYVYEAVLHIDETKDYSLAEQLLIQVSNTKEFDTPARFDLFRCFVLNPEKHITEKVEALDSWIKHVEALGQDSSDNLYLNKNSSYINSYIATVYGQIDDKKESFYDCFRSVKNSEKFNEYLLNVAINRLTSDSKFIEYNKYITDAEKYYDSNDMDIPDLLERALNKNLTKANKDQLRDTFSLIHKLKPKDVIHVIPNLDINKLEFFVLHSILCSVKLMMEKIHSIREKDANGSYKLENQYNDLVKVILSSKFEYLDWHVADQERMGTSAGNKDAGEVDIIIKHKNNTFALIEAFRLKGGDKSVTQTHSNKVNNYAPNIHNYYNLIYYIGDGNIDECWSTYQSHFLETDFTEPLKDSTQFENLSDDFSDFVKMRVAKTTHCKHYYFHIMVDLSNFEG